MLYRIYRVDPDGNRTCLNLHSPYDNAHAATLSVQALNDFAHKNGRDFSYVVETVRLEFAQ